MTAGAFILNSDVKNSSTVFKKIPHRILQTNFKLLGEWNMSESTPQCMLQSIISRCVKAN